ncbi:hypothetical protein BD324DRAFT_579898 [Kockovaella imperatae]|uniref:Cx9C motif-containing protein 4, mitochondrial n=1 Tax=Kockovaella imperatae TaxID=4999 RepID=A0A1Y1UG92_9TREE|nr:hypothetical protein BD324DRAFT_579898 [Kockovaella imperatae]ORX37042.1 hypothetical protein BD324DRAFT_579898 [Kockovaella imperatae]
MEPTQACAIQTCLSKNNYNESKCASYVEALYRCCDTMYKKAEKEGKSADEAKSTACPMREVVSRRMKSITK